MSAPFCSSDSAPHCGSASPLDNFDELRQLMQSPGFHFDPDRFSAELDEYSYFIPPNYPDHLWPEVDAAIMFKIQALKISLEIDQNIVDKKFQFAFIC